jgi:hypothetical protein
MENRVETPFNGVDIDEIHRVADIYNMLETAPDDAKTAYMRRVWNMSRAELFHEVMRVQGEAAKLLMSSQQEIERLKRVVDDNQEESTGD